MVKTTDLSPFKKGYYCYPFTRGLDFEDRNSHWVLKRSPVPMRKPTISAQNAKFCLQCFGQKYPGETALNASTITRLVQQFRDIGSIADRKRSDEQNIKKWASVISLLKEDETDQAIEEPDDIMHINRDRKSKYDKSDRHETFELNSYFQMLPKELYQEN
ncbi:hypothetical protein TNCV_3764281 [Trichonephila clavipes]|uniref:DUF4817 domain-containing protein n=1 Tax=Trichonephila clavipes TaxID=2585209 RepID=A0A8X6VVF3_TRICX|nr:hypothetical protein TNCV_3764281 [Trichonephila clavipes]